MSGGLCSPSIARGLLPCPEAAGFPDPIWVLEAPDGRQACYYVPEWKLAGLAVFSLSEFAEEYSAWFQDIDGLLPRLVPLNFAIDNAIIRDPSIECLVLLDSVLDPMMARLD